MCGIVGAISERNVTNILLEGLKKLEYRGYDSAGIAILDAKTDKINRVRSKGKIANLLQEVEKAPLSGFLGIAHTRWATHGEPSVLNAHPHFSRSQIAVVHNGIIENHDALKKQLTKIGYTFESDTDTEIIAHLIHHYFEKGKGLLKAIHQAISELEGAYALGIIDKDRPNELYAVRSGSPLIIGIGINENFIASDVPALIGVTQQFIYLEEGDIARIKKERYEIYNTNLEPQKRKLFHADSAIEHIHKGSYRHYMQKEIFDQPKAIADTLEGQIQHEQVARQCFGEKSKEIFKKTKRILIVACGTSYHAALVGRDWIESLAKIPCRVEVASENRYRTHLVEPGTLFIAMSQSGETADTLAALKQAKKGEFLATLGICNITNSSLAREADLLFITRAGREIGVAASKTFTCQLIGLILLALSFPAAEENKKLTADLIHEILHLPLLTQEILTLDKKIKTLSHYFHHKRNALFLGRNILFPIAMEGALKLKEISYLHAEAYPAGELKHGPLALIEREMPVIVLAPKNLLFDKISSNIQEVQARDGDLIILTDHEAFENSKNVTIIKMPTLSPFLTPIIYNIPLQLLAYHVAVLKGTDVDQPRNLAKSVTVE